MGVVGSLGGRRSSIVYRLSSIVYRRVIEVEEGRRGDLVPSPVFLALLGCVLVLAAGVGGVS